MVGKVGELGVSGLFKTGPLHSLGPAAALGKGHERHRQQGADGEPGDGEGDEEEELRRRGDIMIEGIMSERKMIFYK